MMLNINVSEKLEKILIDIIYSNDEDYLNPKFSEDFIRELNILGYKETISLSFCSKEFEKKLEVINLGKATLEVESKIVLSGHTNAYYHVFCSNILFEEHEDYRIARDNIYTESESFQNYAQEIHYSNLIKSLQPFAFMVENRDLNKVVMGDFKYDNELAFYCGYPSVKSIFFGDYRGLDV